MKIRTGFVSNSSSSSFCIYGACVNENIVREKYLQKIKKENYSDEEFEGYEMMDELLESADNIFYYQYDDLFFIGRSWRDIGDDETGKQFKESIEKIISEIFDVNDFETIEETFYG